MGTDTGKAPSGTVEEIQEHLEAGRPAMIYFSNKKIEAGDIDQAQYASLVEFKEQCNKRGLNPDFKTEEDFRLTFTRQLHAIVQDKLLPQAPTPEPLEEQLTTQTGLSEDAKEVLLAATEKDDQKIISVLTHSGVSFQAGNKTFCKNGSTREASKWKAALNELLENELAEDCGYKGQVFKITYDGYQLADDLRS